MHRFKDTCYDVKTLKKHILTYFASFFDTIDYRSIVIGNMQMGSNFAAHVSNNLNEFSPFVIFVVIKFQVWPQLDLSLIRISMSYGFQGNQVTCLKHHIQCPWYHTP